ncbi:hypothetical protein WN48_02908 [Eufriesea mexicana]|nr:hypothetical protein WN48_02908 [Eufriesea mexicana]
MLHWILLAYAKSGTIRGAGHAVRLLAHVCLAELLTLNRERKQGFSNPDTFALFPNGVLRVNPTPGLVYVTKISWKSEMAGACFKCAAGTAASIVIYIDLEEDDQSLTLDFRLPRSLQPRMWEMSIVQLGFEQRAPSGCLQYFQSANGTLKTFNFLSNGRFLADQDYLLCIRQERGMCGISYSPCSPDSFRIGPARMQMTNNTSLNASNVDEGLNGNSTAQNATDAGSVNGTDVEGSGSSSVEDAGVSVNSSSPMEEEVPSINTVYGQERCRNRVLIPCDFEEFITPGNNEAGICNLEHCGNSLCDRNELDEEGNCRVETWATPFRIRVAFGPGQDTGTTLEDNIGMCLVYEQLPCVA